MNSSPKITALIMAGGTGGHVYPALALARVLSQRGHHVEWLGTQRGIESRLVPAAGYHLNILNIGGIRGLGVATKLRAPWRIVRAVMQAAGFIRQVKPAVVIGLGGFAAGPGGVAAKMLGKPLIIHEQNAIAGTTNRLLARVSQQRLTAFPDALPASLCIGNPVRHDIEALPTPAQRFAGRGGKPRLLVLGGSLGATAINQMIPAAVAQMPLAERPDIRHQTGEKNLQQTLAFYADAEVKGEVVPYVEDMADALGWADLVVCRAGALTVAELAAAGLGAVLVPFPHAIDDHQTANAEFLASEGAALIRQQKDLDSVELAALLSKLLNDRARMLEMANAARSLAVNHTAERFADICEEIAHG